MTLDTYERAQSLRAEIKHLQDIIDVLTNSRGNYLLASKLSGREIPYITEPVNIIDGVEISLSNEPIIQKMIDLINAEIFAIEAKFNSL